MTTMKELAKIKAERARKRARAAKTESNASKEASPKHIERKPAMKANSSKSSNSSLETEAKPSKPYRSSNSSKSSLKAAGVTARERVAGTSQKTKSTNEKNVASKPPVEKGAGSTKPRHKVRRVVLADRTRLTVRGVSSPSGIRYVNVFDGERSVWSPKAYWAGSSRDALRNLTENNIVIVGSASELCEAVNLLRSYPVAPVIEQVGWTGDKFALPNHRLISPAKKGDSILLFEPDHRVCGQAGTLEGWRTAIEPLAGQLLCEAYLMAGFAAPLLPFAGISFNPGLELPGPAAAGKTALLRLVASIAGPGLDNPDGRYMIDLNATANGIESTLARFRHMPMVADEMALFMPTASESARKAGLVELIFRNSTGSTKARFGGTEQIVTPFVWFVSTNQSYATMIGSNEASLQVALSDRLMSTPLDQNRPHGIFDTLPDGFDSASGLIGTLMSGIGANHGVAMPAFLDRLIRDHAEDADALAKRVRGHISGFMQYVGVDQSSSLSRASRAFGLFYAAGRLAKDYGILPRSFHCREAAHACFSLHCADGRPDLPPYDRLLILSRHPGVVDIDTCDPEKWTEKRARQVPGFWYTNRQGVREFLVLPRRIAQTFPDWFCDQRDSGIERVHRRDKHHGTMKRPIPGIGWTGVHVFVFPEAED